MRKLVIICMLLLPVLALAQEEQYQVTVKLKGLKKHSKAYLVYQYGWTNQRIVDSAGMKKGKFLFKGTIEEPLKTTLIIDHDGEGLGSFKKDADHRVVYLENANMVVKGNDSVKQAVISGSKLNADYAAYTRILAPVEEAVKSVDAEYIAAPAETKKDPAFMSSLEEKLKEIWKLRDSLMYVYISQYPDSYCSLEALKELTANGITDVQQTEPVFKSLSESLRSSKEGMALAKLIENARVTSVGATALDFTQNDENGSPVSLSEFRGKYVLLDFWASWCGPCRAENPNVVKAYNKYHDQGFEILAVSLDNKKEAWLKAIHDDRLTWEHVSDLKGWKNEVAALYGITAVPQNLLIDPNGRIIAKQLRGEDLEEKLKEIFR